jgi:alpha-amylase
MSDLSMSKDYGWQRIVDHFVHLLSIGFSGFRIDAAKHIGPDDLPVTFTKLKSAPGGELPEEWCTGLEVFIGGEADLLVRDSVYSLTTHFDGQLKSNGVSDKGIEQVELWWSAYPTEVDIDEERLRRARKIIQNDNHDQ